MRELSSTLPSLAQTHPTSRLYQRGLDRSVRVLQAVLEGGVLGFFEPSSSVLSLLAACAIAVGVEIVLVVRTNVNGAREV
jgi:hypothetical protein